MSVQEKKLGVYLCGGCGIAEAASLDALEKVAVKEFKAPFCKKHDYLCGEEGQKLIRDDAAAGTMNQAVIAACSPRVNQDKFRFDGVQVVRANLREQVAWTQPARKNRNAGRRQYPHGHHRGAQDHRARALHRGAVQRADSGCWRRLDRPHRCTRSGEVRLWRAAGRADGRARRPRAEPDEARSASRALPRAGSR